MLISILIGLAALSVLLLAHELGHFLAAKALNVRVEEFGLGYPPRLVSFNRGETRYSINVIPFGGFTRLTGEEDPKQPRSLASKGIGARLLILSAGSLMNILLPLILLTIAFMVPHNVLLSEITVKEVSANSPAAMAGILPGDTIISINDKTLNSIVDLNRYIQLHLGNEIKITVRHQDSATAEVLVVPRWKPPEGQGAIGILINPSTSTVVRQSEPFWRAIPMGVTEFAESFVLYKNGIISIIIGATPATFVGPVGIVQATGEIAQSGISPLLEFIALISLILAIGNLFPLPALDGGRIVFVLIEFVRGGKRISPKTEALVHTIGFLLLLAAMVAITYQDIIRIISGESLIP